MVAQINPPITTLARGLELSEPIPVDKAAGIKPMVAIKAVIKTGRISEFTPRLIGCIQRIFTTKSFQILFESGRKQHTFQRYKYQKGR